MNRELILFRHAKSSWSDAGLRDHDRPLNERGRRDAERMGRLAAEVDLVPDIILSSDSTRTRETVAIWIAAASWNGPVRWEQKLYHASPGVLLETAKGVGPDVGRVMLVAHNPGIEELSGAIFGRPVEVPTGTMISAHLKAASWAESSIDDFMPDEIRRPRELPE
ncbi:MAG: hypothetical protein CMJ23_09620 [Phycisphaerae bacterium]|nr:hypothetical protein [Phycisphaerae bacterium]